MNQNGSTKWSGSHFALNVVLVTESLFANVLAVANEVVHARASTTT
jgi:hypothetical protein